MSQYYDFDQGGDVLQQLFNKIAALDNATTEEAGLMSASDKEKLDGIESGAEENAIATIQIGGTALTPDNKVVNIETDSEPTYGSVKLVLSGPLYTKFLSYYTKVEVDQLVAAIRQFVPVVADSLPEASADTMYLLYLIPSTNPKTRNAKDEFITIRSGSEGSYTYFWEQIGTTTIDISGKEDKANKVTSFSNPTDTQYPSAKLVSDSLNKVKDDVSSLLTRAGIAEGIADTISAGTAQEFLQRQSGGDGVNCIKRIKGKTIAWNQLADPRVGTYTDVSVSIDENGVCTISGTSAANRYIPLLQNGVAAPNHKIYVKLTIISGAIVVYDERNIAASGYIRTSSSKVYTAASEVYFYAMRGAGATEDAKFTISIVDLTLLGLGDITATQFEALYPELYYPYNAGVLKNNDAAALLTDGRNQWDEEWENGYYAAEDGRKIYNSEYLMCKNLIPVLPSTRYYINIPGGDIRQRFYRKDKSYIGYEGQRQNSGIIETPQDCYYMAFFVYSTSAYNNDICINLSDPSFDGTYEPYWQRVLALRLSELTGIPEGGTEADRVTMFPNGLGGDTSSHDSIVEGKGNKRMARVDLGTLNWVYDADVPRFFSPGISSLIKGVDSSSVANMISTLYEAISLGRLNTNHPDKTMAVSSTGTISFVNTAYTDAATFKAAMSGVYLEYELATPIIYTDLQYADGTPFTMPATILVDNYGKEVIVPPTGAITPSAPFCCDSNYSISIANLVRKLNSNE